jgi:acyl carrier protein
MLPEAPELLARRAALLDLLRAVLVQKLHVRLQPDQISPDTALFGTGLGLDSIDAVDLATGIQEKTGIPLPQDWEGRTALRSLNTLIDFLIRHEATP